MKTYTDDEFERLARSLVTEITNDQIFPINSINHPDHGIDGANRSSTIFIQAKNYSKPISPNIIREFNGVIASNRNNGTNENIKGYFVTTARLTKQAYTEAKLMPDIIVIDGRLLSLMESGFSGFKKTPKKNIKSLADLNLKVGDILQHKSELAKEYTIKVIDPSQRKSVELYKNSNLLAGPISLSEANQFVQKKLPDIPKGHDAKASWKFEGQLLSNLLHKI